MLAHPVGKTSIAAAAGLAMLACTPPQAQEAWMVVSHEVENYDSWKATFDRALPTRRAVGEMAYFILHDPTNESLVTVWFAWDTAERARAWASDPALANGMAAAGVTSAPTFLFGAIKSTN